MITENTWSYRNETGTKIIVAVLVVLVLSFLTMITLHQGMDPVWILLLGVVIIIAVVVSKPTTGMNIEINRSEGTVTKKEKSFLFKKQKTSSLRMFDAVNMIEKNIAVEEGYGVTLYAIVLQGRDVSLELLSTDDKQEGRRIQKELIEFLELSN
jgi:hypothetical protein